MERAFHLQCITLQYELMTEVRGILRGEKVIYREGVQNKYYRY